jgi:hypothetical protein
MRAPSQRNHRCHDAHRLHSRARYRDLHRPARSRIAGVCDASNHRRSGARELDSHVGQMGADHGGQALPRSSSNRELKRDEKSQRCVPALLAVIVDECQCNAYCRAMPSTRVCGACSRRCRCACRHRRKLCITSCSAARRQLARRRQCDARGAGVGVAGAVWRLVRPVWRRQVARHRVGVFRAASRRSSAATRTRGAGRVLPSLRRRCARTL